MNLKALRPEGMVPQVENGIVLLRHQIENNMIPHKGNLTEGKEGNGKIHLKTNLKLKGMLMNLEENGGNGKILQKMRILYPLLKSKKKITMRPERYMVDQAGVSNPVLLQEMT